MWGWRGLCCCFTSTASLKTSLMLVVFCVMFERMFVFFPGFVFTPTYFVDVACVAAFRAALHVFVVRRVFRLAGVIIHESLHTFRNRCLALHVVPACRFWNASSRRSIPQLPARWVGGRRYALACFRHVAAKSTCAQ